jgi:hypothetical protein
VRQTKIDFAVREEEKRAKDLKHYQRLRALREKKEGAKRRELKRAAHIKSMKDEQRKDRLRAKSRVFEFAYAKIDKAALADRYYTSLHRNFEQERLSISVHNAKRATQIYSWAKPPADGELIRLQQIETESIREHSVNTRGSTRGSTLGGARGRFSREGRTKSREPASLESLRAKPSELLMTDDMEAEVVPEGDETYDEDEYGDEFGQDNGDDEDDYGDENDFGGQEEEEEGEDEAAIRARAEASAAEAEAARLEDEAAEEEAAIRARAEASAAEAARLEYEAAEEAARKAEEKYLTPKLQHVSPLAEQAQEEEEDGDEYGDDGEFAEAEGEAEVEIEPPGLDRVTTVALTPRATEQETAMVSAAVSVELQNAVESLVLQTEGNGRGDEQMPPMPRSVSLIEVYQAEAKADVSACGACGRTTTKKGKPLKPCPNCAATAYCSSKCQKADWTSHREICLSLTAKYEAAKAAEQERLTAIKEESA